MSGKPIECREMLKHEPEMVEDISHMAIPRLLENGLRTGLFFQGTSTSGWSRKTWKNRFLVSSLALEGQVASVGSRFTGGLHS